MYYLGEDNLKSFENYLEDKATKIKKKAQCSKSFEMIAKAFQNIFAQESQQTHSIAKKKRTQRKNLSEGCFENKSIKTDHNESFFSQ